MQWPILKVELRINKTNLNMTCKLGNILKSQVFLEARNTFCSSHCPPRPHSQPSGNGGGSFSSDFGPVSGFENWSSQWLSIRETSIFKIKMINDVNDQWWLVSQLAFCQFHVGGHHIDRVSSFAHLGHVINSELSNRAK